MNVSGCNNHYKFVLRAGAKVEERSDEIPPWRGKKCDNLSRDLGKQLTHIVRDSICGVSWVVTGYEEWKSSLKQQRNCKHDDSQGILSLSMGNEPVSYKNWSTGGLTEQRCVKVLWSGLSVKMFRHIDQTALWCSLFKSWVLLASRLMTEGLEKVWIYSVLV